MKRVVSFGIVFIVTTLAWLLLGYLIRLVFPNLSMYLFLIIGVAAGLLIASLLALMHEDPVRLSDSLPDFPAKSPIEPLPPRPGIRPNAGGDSQLPQQP